MSEERPLVAELERRIHEMEQHAEASFGAFTTLDWVLCGVIGIAVPALIVWFIWP